MQVQCRRHKHVQRHVYSLGHVQTYTSGRYSLTSLVVTDSGLGTPTALGTGTDSLSGTCFETLTLGGGGSNVYTMGYNSGSSNNYTHRSASQYATPASRGIRSSNVPAITHLHGLEWHGTKIVRNMM